MDDKSDPPALGFAQTRLPWLTAAAALVVYLVTLNRWVRLESLPIVAQLTGLDWAPILSAPLYYLATLPVRLLPAGIQPLGMNVLSAFMGAATLGLLVRCVALLPYDRTRESRIRERNQDGLLSIPLAWIGPVVAAVACGLQLTFWENATVATGEMLDLLLFAYIVRCLLEYRLTGEESWLPQTAFVYGLAITNNYAMIAFFPCFVIAVAWMLGFGFFNLRLLGRMFFSGLLGLLPYLLLPAVAVAQGNDQGLGFWGCLKEVLAGQKRALASVPPFLILLSAGTSVLPVLLMGVRWKATQGDTSRAGVAMTEFITRFMHIVMLAGAVSIFFSPVWAPRSLVPWRPLLPLYFLASLAVGYYVGYLLLMTCDPVSRAKFRVAPQMRLLNQAVAVLAVVGAVAAGVMGARNYAAIREQDGALLETFASTLLGSLPAGPAYVLSDNRDFRNDQLLIESLQRRQSGRGDYVMLDSRMMPYQMYHKALAKRYGARWPFAAVVESAGDPVDNAALSAIVGALAQSNRVLYLHPSMGYYFEAVSAQPLGMVSDLQTCSAANLAPAIPAETLAANQKYWEGLDPELAKLPPLTDESLLQARYVTRYITRALNRWGVTLQRNGRLPEAKRCFERVLKLDPKNLSAKISLAFNGELQQGKIRPLEAPLPLDLSGEKRSLDQVLMQDGPFDDPVLCFNLGGVFAQSALFRQALMEYQRARALYPNDPKLQEWEETMQIMARFGLGDVEGAEKQALALLAKHPKSDNVLETLTQIYLHTGRYTNALAMIDRQLQVDPVNSRALLNKGALCIQTKNYAGAVSPLSVLLEKQPQNAAALMNRAIANLQVGQLDAAARDYAVLSELMPEQHAVYYGLGEVALRKNDRKTALANFEKYLKYGVKDSEEYKSVAEKVRQLKGGSS